MHGVPLPNYRGYRGGLRHLLRDGLNGVSFSRALIHAQHIDELYRDRDQIYMREMDKLISSLESYDILIFSTYCPIHPDLLSAKLSSKIKVLGFTDDPHSTYVRGIPFLWAFDAAYYISPGYSPTKGFEEFMRDIGMAKATWLPLAQPIDYPELTYDQILDRDVAVTYVGAPTGSKIDRLRALDRAFGKNFALFGRWRMNGYYGFVRPFVGEQIFPRRVKSIGHADKQQLYLRSAIGFNMHVSDQPSECGNMRTYETAAYGMMPLCDRAGLNLQTRIFAENTEAVYYDDMDEAVTLIRHYIAHPEERAAIAWAAYQKAYAQYNWNTVTENFLNWLTADDKT